MAGKGRKKGKGKKARGGTLSGVVSKDDVRKVGLDLVEAAITGAAAAAGAALVSTAKKRTRTDSGAAAAKALAKKAAGRVKRVAKKK